MEAQRTNRIWLIGGIVAIVIVVASAWLLAISPKYAEADGVQDEAEDTTIQLTRLKKEVAELEGQNAKKATYQAQLDNLVTNLPETYGMPVFLRSLQDTGAKIGVDVKVLSAGNVLKSETVPSAAEMPLSLSVSGTAATISKFLVRLQTTQSRAVRIDAINLSGGSDTPVVTANLTLTAFCTTSDVADGAKANRTDKCAVS